MKLNIAVLPGDGIGPEIVEQGMKAVKAVCEKYGHELSYKHALVGAVAIDETGNPYPDETHELCMQSDAFILVRSVLLNMIITLPQRYAPNKDCWECVRSWDFLPISVR